MNNPNPSTPINFEDMLLAPVVATATRIALLVGSILALINHGPAMIAMDVSVTAWLQIGLTYLVPYGVSTYSSIKMLAQQRSRQV